MSEMERDDDRIAEARAKKLEKPFTISFVSREGIADRMDLPIEEVLKITDSQMEQIAEYMANYMDGGNYTEAMEDAIDSTLPICEVCEKLIEDEDEGHPQCQQQKHEDEQVEKHIDDEALDRLIQKEG